MNKGKLIASAIEDVIEGIIVEAKQWAADDRKWNTQEMIENNLIAFASLAIKKICVATAKLYPNESNG